MRSLGPSVIKALALCALPTVQYLLLRVYVRDVMGAKIGWPLGYTDFDFVWPGALAFGALFCLMDSAQPLSLRFGGRRLGVNVGLFALSIAIAFGMQQGLASGDPQAVAVLVGLVLAVLTSAFFTVLSPRDFFSHSYRRLIPVAGLLAGSNLIAKGVFGFLWEPVNALTGRLVCNGTRWVLPWAECQFGHMDANGALYTIVIGSPFVIAIGKGCAGLEGMFFFLMLFIVAVVSNPAVFGFKRATAVLLSGLVFMYWLNLVRIWVFYFVSRQAIILLPEGQGVGVALTLFHQNLGWVLYVLGISLFFHLVYRDVQPTRSPSWKLGWLVR